MADIPFLARRILTLEAEAVRQLADRLDDRFVRAVRLILHCNGQVIVSGIGKAGLVGQKLVATFASTGTPSHFLHPAEAVHGDLGRVGPNDIVLILSQSGETEEITRILPSFRSLGVSILAITASETSTLGNHAEIVLPLGRLEEADSLGLAPTTSTTAMIALGDALALVVSEQRGFRAEDFARFHPGGALGRKLSLVDDYCRPLAQCRVAPDSETVREVFVRHGIVGRRSGAILLLDADKRLAGIFTDSDLAKLFERHRDHLLDSPIRDVMTSKPTTVRCGSKMLEAVALMGERRISELPVLDVDGFPHGIIDITDVVAAFPEYAAFREEPGPAAFQKEPGSEVPEIRPVKLKIA